MVRMPAVQRRRELVAAAFTVIATHGLAGASIRAIVAEAGMSLASFHYAFSSRDELLEVLVTEATAKEQAAVLPAGGSGQSLEELVVEALGGYLDHLRADPQREQAMLELTLYAVRRRGDFARAQYFRYQEIATAAVELAAAQLGVRWLVPVATVTRLLVQLTDGLTLAWLVDRDDEAAQATIRAAARAVVALAC